MEEPLDRINPDAAKYFPEIRKLVLAGKIREAQKLELLHCLEHLRANGHIRPCVM